MKTAKALVSIVAASILLIGCTLPRPGKDIGGQFPTEIIPTHPASISKARVTQKGDSVVVSGTIRKSHEFHLPGHVDVVACGGDGKPIARARPQITGYGSKRGGMKEASFSARIPGVPAPGAYFRLRYDAPGAPQEELLCR